MKSYQPLPLNELSGIVSQIMPCILLDTARPSKTQRYSYFFHDPVRTLIAQTYDDVEKQLHEIDRWSKTHWLCGYITYEAAYAFEEKFAPFRLADAQALPLIWFGVFEKPLIYDHISGAWDGALPKTASEIINDSNQKEKPVITHSIDEAVFKEKIASIKNEIKNGETYQVNFTYAVGLKSTMPPFSLYKQLRENQKTWYCAFLKNEFGHVLSFSPELFFSIRGNTISVKPMKGTVRRGYSAEVDRALINFLENDTKNRAENLMIVDLLRNDLGKICKPGTVITEKLFEVETHPTIHQMTSTIRGALKKNIRYSDLIKSIFPCGSVTGAPKIRTMEIIHDLESGRRGVYCGALGYISPGRRAAFNVPIRTLQRNRNENEWRFRVGSGIIWDSSDGEEWKECAEKSRFLEHDMPDFEIVETLLFKKKYVFEKDHVSRMQSSAGFFNYPFSRQSLKKFMNETALKLMPDTAYKVRLLLDKNGGLRCEHTVLSTTGAAQNLLRISSIPLDENNLFLFHKTTNRRWYLEAMNTISAGACYDILYCNSKGEVCEGAINNIFIEKDDILYTPPVTCGLLPGVLRKNLLRKGQCIEKILYLDDILYADKVFCGNSVRGLIRVTMEK